MAPFNFVTLVILLVHHIWYVNSKSTWTKNPVERPLSVGSFNIQNLGNSKLANVTIMNIVKQILLRYDLVLIQEIVTLNEDAMPKFLKEFNKAAGKDGKYKMTISERLGRGTAKEQYAFLYRSDRLNLIKSQVYPDKEDLFMRPPFIAMFSTPTLRDLGKLLAIGVHTQPKNAANETSSMATVYDYAAETFRIKDAIIMGDMNIGCQNMRISDWQWIELWQRPEFMWLINNDVDTTVSPNCCPYDRIVIAGENMGDAVIWESAKPFNYRKEYGTTMEMALAVSDHWPVEAKLRGGTSSNAHHNLDTNLCVSVEDRRKNSLPDALSKQKTTYGFSIQITDEYAMLRGQNADQDELLSNLQKVADRYPDLLSVEAAEAVVYKVKHGALKDDSSYADLMQRLYNAYVTLDRETRLTSVEYCAATTIN